MTGLLLFAVTLLVAVYLSELARRSVLSTTVLFLAAGFVASGVLGVIDVSPASEQVRILAILALFSVLYTDGMRVELGEIRRSWQLPGRALLFGLPLTLVLAAVAGRYLAHLPWDEALLLGAILSPTDPVLAAALVRMDKVPVHLRRLLNVESGVNDGLALPFVLVLVAVAGSGAPAPATIALEILGGLGIGILVPFVALNLQDQSFVSVSSRYQPLMGLALGLTVLALTQVTNTNSYLAAFAAGAVVGNVRPQSMERFGPLGEALTEVLKLAAVLYFGALISPAFLADIPIGGYLFAVVTLLAVRPLALALSLFRALPLREWAGIAWFGPKGFASVVFALLVFVDLPQDANLVFHLAALVVAMSMIVHSSSDILVIKWLGLSGREAAEAVERAQAPNE